MHGVAGAPVTSSGAGVHQRPFDACTGGARPPAHAPLSCEEKRRAQALPWVRPSMRPCAGIAVPSQPCSSGCSPGSLGQGRVLLLACMHP